MEDLDEKISLLKGKPVAKGASKKVEDDNEPDSQTWLESINHKIELLNLADEMGSVSKACKVLGYSRQSYYRYKDAYARAGYAGLLNQKRTPTKRKPSIGATIENAVIAYAYQFPEHGKTKASAELSKVGVSIGPNDVNNIWVRYGLSNAHARNIADQVPCKDKHIQQRIVQVIAELKKIDREEKLIKDGYPGYLGVQECYFFGAIQSIGLLYQQVFVDVFSQVAFVKFYTGKKPPNSVDLLSDKVIPFYSGQSVKLQKIVTIRSKLYYGQNNSHPYQQYLALQNIKHSKISPKFHSDENFCEHFHHTLQVEFKHNALSKSDYGSLSFIQKEMDEWLDFYNNRRSHPGERCNGRTPMETFITAKNELNSRIEPGKQGIKEFKK